MILKKVTEYEEISKDDIGHKFFKELEEFAQNNPSLLSYSKSGKLKPRQYVGIIQTKSGVLEIYPKITGANKEDSKLVFLKMLKTLKNHPFKDIHLSDLEIKKLPLLEIFIRMFLVELRKVVQNRMKQNTFIIPIIRDDLIERCLDTLYKHTPDNFYVIVIDESKSEMQKALVDNNLTDVYANNIEGYSSLILDNFEQVISISMERVQSLWDNALIASSRTASQG
jgi:hypothetical protein